MKRIVIWFARDVVPYLLLSFFEIWRLIQLLVTNRISPRRRLNVNLLDVNFETLNNVFFTLLNIIRLLHFLWTSGSMFAYQEHSPCEITPSSSNACHIPVAMCRELTLAVSDINQSTSSLPLAHLRTMMRPPEDFLSRRIPLASFRSNVLRTHPARAIGTLGLCTSENNVFTKLLQNNGK